MEKSEEQVMAERYECEAAAMRTYPSYMLRPRLSIDGNQWCALYGDNLQDGVAGFGDSPFEAFRDFDDNFIKKLPEQREG